MGSMTSRPEVPQSNVTQPQVVYVPHPQTSVPEKQEELEDIRKPANNSEGSENNKNNDEPDTQSPESTRSALRIESLLRRNRGVSGTVRTGFRGLLSQAETAPRRKTLLGE